LRRYPSAKIFGPRHPFVTIAKGQSAANNAKVRHLIVGHIFDLAAVYPADPANSIPISKPVRGPVAVLGTEASIDTDTLMFGSDRAAPEATPAPRLRDVNANSYLDLVAFFRGDAASITDTEVCLLGGTLDGTPFEGCDAIRTVPDMD
jgi:hypothetical protein